MFDKFGEITLGKVIKATLIGGGVCAAAIAAPIGIVAVAGITAAGVGASWVADSVGDGLNGKDKEESDS